MLEMYRIRIINFENFLKGCIFVAFVNREDAQKVIDATEVKYGDKVLLKENK